MKLLLIRLNMLNNKGFAHFFFKITCHVFAYLPHLIQASSLDFKRDSSVHLSLFFFFFFVRRWERRRRKRGRKDCQTSLQSLFFLVFSNNISSFKRGICCLWMKLGIAMEVFMHFLRYPLIGLPPEPVD